MLLFRPLAVEQLRALGRGEAVAAGPAFAATAGFLAEFGLDAPDDEDAERTLLYLAGLAALLRHGRRLVAVSEARVVTEAGASGSVLGPPVTLAGISSLFADDPAGEPLADAAAAALAGVDEADAWEHPAHEALLAGADLLWFGPEEWGVLTGDAAATAAGGA